VKDSKAIESFSFGQVVHLSGVKARTLDHWAATAFLPPSLRKAGGSGTKRAYSFADVVAARVAKDLRSAGASLQGLRKVVRELRKMDFTNPLAEALLIVSGKEVYLYDNQELISILGDPKQAIFPFFVLNLDETLSLIRRRPDYPFENRKPASSSREAHGSRESQRRRIKKMA